MTVSIKNISLKYAGTEASPSNFILKNLSLIINQGEFVCLLGHSGCGKSSLLGLVAGFVKVSHGEIIVNGKKVTRPDISRTLVFQEYALFPWLNVIENVAFGLRYKVRNKEERFIEATRYLKMVGLLEHARDNISQLSGGMKQRVAIARALAVKPDLLLLDEPFGALDDQTRNNMQVLITDIWQDLKPTILFVTHSVDEALKLADRVIVMGNSIESDTIGEIKADIKININKPRNLNDLSAYRSKILDVIYDKETNSETLFDAGI